DAIAQIDLTQARDARNRSLPLSIVELGLGVGDGSLVGRDLRGQLRNRRTLGVGLLPRGEFAEFGVALQIEIGVRQIGFVLHLLGPGLVERGLERPRIDLGEQVTLIDRLAFLETDLVDLSIDAGTYN